MAGRRNKLKLDWFKMDVAMDTKVELLEAEYGLKGFAIFVKLLQRIYGEQGYYCEWNEEVRLLFSRRIGEGCNLVSEVVDSAIKRGLFNTELFEKYSILTSEGIQERYLDAINKRGSIEMKSEYLLVHGAENLKNVVIISINNNKNVINDVKNKQNRKEQNRTEKRRIEKNSSALAAHYDNPELNQLFCDFLDIRKNMEASNTDYTIGMLKKKISDLSDTEKIEVIEESIMNSWKGLFPDKRKNIQKKNNTDIQVTEDRKKAYAELDQLDEAWLMEDIGEGNE